MGSRRDLMSLYRYAYENSRRDCEICQVPWQSYVWVSQYFGGGGGLTTFASYAMQVKVAIRTGIYKYSNAFKRIHKNHKDFMRLKA